MTQNLQQPIDDFAQWTDGGDIFFRPQDKKQFQRSLKAITADRLGLAVVADNEKILNHYCRLTVSRLRATKDFSLEILSPSNTDTLLKRFNQIMASMSLDEALRPAAEDSQITLMVVNDAHLVEKEQWQLLSQLLSDFPGVNIRLVLFIDRSEWPLYEKPLKLFGRNLHLWKLEHLYEKEARDLLITAENNGYREEVESLLSGLALDISNDIKDEDVFPSVDDAKSEATISPVLVDKSTDQGKAKEQNNVISHQQASKTSWAILTILLLVASWIVMSIIDPEAMSRFTSGETSSRPLSNIKLSDSEALSKSVPVMGAAVGEFGSKAGQQKSDTEPAPLSALSPRDTIQMSKESDYFIQHILFKEEATAKLYLEKNDQFKGAMIVSMNLKGELLHGLVSGPFRSELDARVALAKIDGSTDGWIRKSNQIKGALLK